MTLLILPPIRDGAGAPVPARVTITLVDHKGRARPMWYMADGTLVDEALNRPIDDAAVTVDLVPQSLLAIETSSLPTYYTVVYSVRGREERYRVQVPESPGSVELMDLVGAAAVEPGQIVPLVGGLKTRATAGAALTANPPEPCYFGADERAYPASAAAGGRIAVALPLAPLAEGEAGDFLLWGFAESNGWDFAPHGSEHPLYLGTTAGTVRQAAPEGSNEIIQLLGYPVTATKILWRPELSHFTHK